MSSTILNEDSDSGILHTHNPLLTLYEHLKTDLFGRA